MPIRYKGKKSIGALFRKLQRIILGSPEKKKEVTIQYIPYSFSIDVAPLRIYSKGRLLCAPSDKEGKKLAKLIKLNQAIEILDILDECD